MSDEIKFVPSNEAFGENDIQAFQVISMEDPYHPRDIGFAKTYEGAVAIAKAWDLGGIASMYGGMGMRIEEIRIQG